MITYWVLWFVVTLLNEEKLHVPVEEHYPSEAACEADLPHWQQLIESQFPDDPNVRTYCEEFIPTLPTKEM